MFVLQTANGVHAKNHVQSAAVAPINQKTRGIVDRANEADRAHRRRMLVIHFLQHDLSSGRVLRANTRYGFFVWEYQLIASNVFISAVRESGYSGSGK